MNSDLEPTVVRRYPVTAAKIQNPMSYLITRLSHPLKSKSEQYKANLSIEVVDRKIEEDASKKDRMDKAKYSGKVTSTDIKRSEKMRALKGLEYRLTERNQDQSSSYNGSLVEGQKSKHMLLFVRGSSGGQSVHLTGVPVSGWMHFQKDIEELRNKKDPFLKMTKEQQKAALLKQKSTLNMLTEILESDEEAEQNPRSVSKMERGLQPLKIFKPRGLRTEEDGIYEGPRVVTQEMADFANKISVRAKQMRKEKTKKQTKEKEAQKERDEEQDSDSSQDSAYHNYFGRIAEKRRKDREGLDFDEEFDNDEEEDQLFMNDDEYVRDLDPGVIKGGKQKQSHVSSKSRKLISKYEKDDDEEEDDEQDEEDQVDEGSEFSNEWPSSEEPNRAKMLGSRREPDYAPDFMGSEKRGILGKVKLTEHILIEELRKEAKFEIHDFCGTLERRYDIGEAKDFNKMIRRLANIDEGKWLILKEQYRPTYSKSTLLFEKGGNPK